MNEEIKEGSALGGNSAAPIDLGVVRREREVARRRKHGGRAPQLESEHKEKKTAVETTLTGLKIHANEKIHSVASARTGDTFTQDEAHALKGIVIDFAKNAEHYVETILVLDHISQYNVHNALERITQELQPREQTDPEPTTTAREDELKKIYTAIDAVYNTVTSAVSAAIV